MGSTVGDSSPPVESLGLQIHHHIPLEVDCNSHPPPEAQPTSLITETEFRLEQDEEAVKGGAPPPNVEHQFIPSFPGESALHKENQTGEDRKPTENLASLWNDGEGSGGGGGGGGEEITVSLGLLGDSNEGNKRKRCDDVEVGNGDQELV
ncbi:unnamed protein product [Linum trigynum]